MNFSGKTVLITGAAGGIGREILRLFRLSGAQIAAADLKLDDVIADAYFSGNLTDKNYIEHLPLKVIDKFGSLDILINNAGIIRRGDVLASTDEDFDVSIAINVKAPFQLCRSTIPFMLKQGGGAIVNIASCWGVHPGPEHVTYCMSKAAIASLTQCIGRDHAHQNIRVNAVCPNEVDTPMLRTGFEMRGFDADTAIANLGKTVPLGRVATPNDIAEIVLFLASDHARYICGSLIKVNGAKPVG